MNGLPSPWNFGTGERTDDVDFHVTDAYVGIGCIYEWNDMLQIQASINLIYTDVNSKANIYLMALS